MNANVKLNNFYKQSKRGSKVLSDLTSSKQKPDLERKIGGVELPNEICTRNVLESGSEIEKNNCEVCSGNGHDTTNSSTQTFRCDKHREPKRILLKMGEQEPKKISKQKISKRGLKKSQTAAALLTSSQVALSGRGS